VSASTTRELTTQPRRQSSRSLSPMSLRSNSNGFLDLLYPARRRREYHGTFSTETDENPGTCSSNRREQIGRCSCRLRDDVDSRRGLVVEGGYSRCHCRFEVDVEIAEDRLLVDHTVLDKANGAKLERQTRRPVGIIAKSSQNARGVVAVDIRAVVPLRQQSFSYRPPTHRLSFKWLYNPSITVRQGRSAYPHVPPGSSCTGSRARSTYFAPARHSRRATATSLDH
jgi:hypothetical protein